MRVNTCFLRNNDKCQDAHLNEEYQLDHPTSQRQPLQQGKIWSGHRPKLMAAMGSEEIWQTIDLRLQKQKITGSRKYHLIYGESAFHKREFL